MNGDKIRITAEDLARVEMPAEQQAAAAQAQAPAGTVRCYGNITTEAPAVQPERGSLLLQAWFYLGMAGLAGTFIAWAICEPYFVDGGPPRWGNRLLMPAILALMCFGFGTAESIVERSFRRVLMRGSLSLLLGVVFGFVVEFIANIVFNIGLGILAEAGVQSVKSPAFWVNRAVGWMVFGAAGGVVYGMVGSSSKKASYGCLGGLLGAGLGGLLFDPIAFLFELGGASRLVGFSLFGCATGVAIGLVESALKDRWLYVMAGPLAGKQFILYKPLTVIGCEQRCDIYLFKDKSVLPQHAIIEAKGNYLYIRALGPLYVSGQSTQNHLLRSDELIQIGRYAFRYHERQRKPR